MSPISDVDAALDFRRTIADRADIRTGVRRPSGWDLVGGVLRNTTANFFEVVAGEDGLGHESLLLRQSETALVGLAIARADNGRYFLLNARSEPGLHGLCQFSSTVQSTPSNYERRHGGAATFFIDHFVGSRSDVTVLHDSLEYDWGQYYDRKTKRFLIIEVDEMVTPVDPCVWVSEDVLRDLLGLDYLVTADLRAAITLLDARESLGARYDPTAPEKHDDSSTSRALHERALGQLSDWALDDLGIRENSPRQGVSVEYVEMRSSTREVSAWTQPLMRVAEPVEVTLAYARVGAETVVAVAKATQIGLGGRELYFPAQFELADAAIVRSIRTSAEGGRFFQHEVLLRLVEIDPEDRSADPQVMRLSGDDVRRLILQPGSTSVELRLAASMLWSIGDRDA